MGVVNKKRRSEKPGDEIYFLILLAHIYFEYVRPATVFPFLSPFKLGGLLLLASVLIWLFRCSKDALRDPLIKVYCVGLAQMVVWVPLAVNNYHAFNHTMDLTYYLIGAILPLAALINTDDRLRRFFHHWVVINFLVALVTVRAGGKGTGGFLADENDVGLAMNMALPFAAYLCFLPDISRLRRWFYILASVTILFAIVYSKSRGALVGLVAVSTIMWLLSKKKVKNLAIAVSVALLFGGIVVSLLPAGYFERMQTASDPNNSTRVERIYSWQIGWEMFKHNPVFGVGPGNYPYRVVEYQDLVRRPSGRPPIPGRVAHSLYFTLFPELGLVGTLIFAYLSVGIVTRMRAIYKIPRKRVAIADQTPRDYQLIAKAIVVSLFAYLSAGAFITVNYYPCYWLLLGFAVILYRRYQAHTPAAPDLKT
jgi:O-antigen ligase